MNWTHITDPDDVVRLLPAWFSGRMIGLRGSFGLLLTTGDVMRITSIMAVHHGSDGTLLADVLLDHAGPPEDVDLAWRSKHFLGAPVPGATMATVNMAHVVTAVEFVATEIAEPANDLTVLMGDEGPSSVEVLGELPAVVAVVGERLP